MRPEYAVWLAEKRASAKARGGKPLRNLPGAGTEFSLPRSKGRAKGEIVNPVTGEVVSGCLTIAKLADSLKLRPVEVTDILEELGCVQRVPKPYGTQMMHDPSGFLVKPSFFHAPEVTQYGLEECLVIPLILARKGAALYTVLVTPAGQSLVRESLMEVAVASIPGVERTTNADTAVKDKATFNHMSVLALSRHGVGVEEIAQTLDLSPRHVRRLLKTHCPAYEGERDEVASRREAELRARADRSVAFVRPDDILTDREIASRDMRSAIAQCLAEGLSQAEAARRLGITRQRLQYHLAKNGQTVRVLKTQKDTQDTEIIT